MNIFFQDYIPLSIDIENELQDVFDHPSPYMWNIHYMMRENIVITPSSRGFVPISPVPFFMDHVEEEEKIELDEKETEKVVEIENIVKEVIGYIMILYKDDMIHEKVNVKIQEWKEEKIQNISTHMDMDIRNEVLKEVLKFVS